MLDLKIFLRTFNFPAHSLFLFHYQICKEYPPQKECLPKNATFGHVYFPASFFIFFFFTPTAFYYSVPETFHKMVKKEKKNRWGGGERKKEKETSPNPAQNFTTTAQLMIFSPLFPVSSKPIVCKAHFPMHLNDRYRL